MSTTHFGAVMVKGVWGQQHIRHVKFSVNHPAWAVHSPQSVNRHIYTNPEVRQHEKQGFNVDKIFHELAHEEVSKQVDEHIDKLNQRNAEYQ